MNNNRGGPRPCRYGSSCRNPTCSFDHTPSISLPPSNMPAQNIMCRYGPSCWRSDCKYSHEYQNSSSSPYNQPYGVSPYSAPTQQLCRFGAACFSSECRFAHPPPVNNQPDVEFTSEEEEFMDEILDMIEQEQKPNNNKSNGGIHKRESYDEEDDKNIDEILDFIDQQGHQTVFETEYISPEDAEKEYKDMLEFDAQRRAADSMLNGMAHMNIKGMNASAQPFVPRTSS